MKDVLIALIIGFTVICVLGSLGRGIAWQNQNYINKREICTQTTGNPMYCFERYR